MNKYYAETGVEVLTFISRAPINEFAKPGYIVINVDIKSLKDAIGQENLNGYNFVLNDNNEVILSNNMSFVKPYYIPLVIRLITSTDIKDYMLQDKITHLCLSIINKYFSKFVDISTGVAVDNNRYAFLINTSQFSIDEAFKENINTACRNINNIMNNEADTVILFSFGQIVDDLHNVYDSFMSARQKLKYKLSISENNVYYARQLDVSKAYPFKISKSIINAINIQDKNSIKRSVQDFFASGLADGPCDLNEFQNRVLYILYIVYNHFIEEGMELSISNYNISKWFEDSSDTEELKDKIIDCFCKLMDLASKEANININEYVSKAIKYMEKNYQNDLSVNAIANYVSLHPNYLSRIFKEYTGKTIIEYLTGLRIKKSKYMLVGTNHTIKNISTRLGYYDSRSFMRYFKKYEGMTPGKYRANHRKNSTP